MSRTSTKPKESKFFTQADVAGYTVSRLSASRSRDIASIRLLGGGPGNATDVGYIYFRKNRLPNDCVRDPKTDRKTIVMYATIADYDRVLDMLRHEWRVRINFEGTSAKNGSAYLTSLRHNFPTLSMQS